MAEEIARLNVSAMSLEIKDVAELTARNCGRAESRFLALSGWRGGGRRIGFIRGGEFPISGGWRRYRSIAGAGMRSGLLRHMDAFMRLRYGVKEIVLHATEMGRPVYERMGFQAVDEFAAYLCVPEMKMGNAGNGGMPKTGGYDETIDDGGVLVAALLLCAGARLRRRGHRWKEPWRLRGSW